MVGRADTWVCPYTSRLTPNAYAQIKVRIAATAVNIRAIGTTTRITLDSVPRLSMVAAAFCSLAGEMTLANPPAMAVPAVTTRAFTLSNFEVRMLYLVNSAIVDASLPLTKPPSSPRKAAAAG